MTKEEMNLAAAKHALGGDHPVDDQTTKALSKVGGDVVAQWKREQETPKTLAL